MPRKTMSRSMPFSNSLVTLHLVIRWTNGLASYAFMRSPSQMWSRVSTGSPGFRFAFTGTVLSILNIAASFVSKGDHWIHFRCAARRDVASQERDGAQHERNDDKCDRVYGTNTEEQVLD